MNASVSLLSKQIYEDHTEKQKAGLSGKFFPRKPGFVLRYFQPTEGAAPVHTTLTWDGSTLRIHKRGTPAESDMIFSGAGKVPLRHEFLYSTPVGMINLATETEELSVTAAENRADILIRYRLLDGTGMLSENEIRFEVSLSPGD